MSIGYRIFLVVVYIPLIPIVVVLIVIGSVLFASAAMAVTSHR